MLTGPAHGLTLHEPYAQDSAYLSASSQGETRTDLATVSTQWLQDNPEPLLGPGGSSRRSVSSQQSPGSLAMLTDGRLRAVFTWDSP